MILKKKTYASGKVGGVCLGGDGRGGVRACVRARVCRGVGWRSGGGFIKIKWGGGLACVCKRGRCGGGGGACPARNGATSIDTTDTDISDRARGERARTSKRASGGE